MRNVVLTLGIFLGLAAQAGDYFHAIASGGVERYYEATPTGVRAYVADLNAMDPSSARLLAPALHRLEEKEERAALAASLQGFTGAVFFFSSFTLLRDKRDRSMNAPAAVLGVTMMAAAVVLYDLFSPSRADILEFINAHNESLPVPPLHYRLDPSIPYVAAPAASAAGVTIPF